MIHLNLHLNQKEFDKKVALITFGGAYTVLPYVYQGTVNYYHWLAPTQMIDGLALGETTPGPLIMVLAFVGFMGGYQAFGSSLLAGSIGLLTTTYYTFLPFFFFIFAGAPIIEKTQHNTHIKQILSFVTAAVTGVILNLTLYFAEAVIFGKTAENLLSINWHEVQWLNVIWIVISVIALYRYKIDMLIWLAVSAIFGLTTYFIA
ncbi:MAG TPA: chromate transporter [Chitinophagales bacterium]|nr:chromate transporter [Chitinophagales bacterium]